MSQPAGARVEHRVAGTQGTDRRARGNTGARSQNGGGGWEGGGGGGGYATFTS